MFTPSAGIRSSKAYDHRCTIIFMSICRRIVGEGLSHVKNCLLCQARGFICEGCHLDPVIFPFQVPYHFDADPNWILHFDTELDPDPGLDQDQALPSEKKKLYAIVAKYHLKP